MTSLPPEPGEVIDLEHGVTDESIPAPAEVDDSSDDEGAEVNDYDGFPDDPDEEE